MRCGMCQGTGRTRAITGPADLCRIEPAFADGEGVGPCMNCQGSGLGGHDFDQQSLTLRLPPDDDGTPGEIVDLSCQRCNPIGSDRPLRAEVEIRLGTAAFCLTDLTPQLMKMIGRFLLDYEGRMQRW